LARKCKHEDIVEKEKFKNNNKLKKDILEN
jgi:hypothetical protein